MFSFSPDAIPRYFVERRSKYHYYRRMMRGDMNYYRPESRSQAHPCTDH